MEGRSLKTGMGEEWGEDKGIISFYINASEYPLRFGHLPAYKKYILSCQWTARMITLMDKGRVTDVV